jgi:hypothetical protein
MDHRAQTHILWEHTCCRSTRWSAARLCDRCGARAAATIVGVTVADAMARLNSLDDRPVSMNSALSNQAAADSAVVSAHQHVRPEGRSAAGEGWPVAYGRDVCWEDRDELPPPSSTPSLHPDLERAFVFGLWLLGGVVSSFMAIGAVVDFERANYFGSFTRAIAAAAGPTSVIALAIDGWVRQRRPKMQRANSRASSAT